MIQKEVTAQVPEKKDKKGNITQKHLGPATIFVNYPETLDEANEMFGAEPMLTNAFANWKVVVQGGIRTGLKAGLDAKGLQDKLGSAVMGIATAGGKVDNQAAFIAKFGISTPEKQAELLEMLRRAAQGEAAQE